MSQVTLYVPDDIHEKLKSLAVKEDRSISNYINRLLKLHVGLRTDTTITVTNNNNTIAVTTTQLKRKEEKNHAN